MRRQQYKAVSVRIATIRAQLSEAEEIMQRLADENDEDIRVKENRLSASGALIEMQGDAALRKARRQLDELIEEYDSAKRTEEMVG